MNSSKTGQRYRALHIDPPWRFQNYSAKGEGRNAVSHYNCLSVEALSALPIDKLADEDCAMFLWTTDPFLPVALKLIKDWGFEYKTVGFYWAKTNRTADLSSLTERDFFCGLGYWTRANLEQCLLATRGSPRRVARDVRRLIISPRREHSRKPDEVYARIERLVEGPYLDMFARETRAKWDAWGDEATLFDSDSAVRTRRRPSN
jgi:N6-adenosine-specific RNA methylase IME4